MIGCQALLSGTKVEISITNFASPDTVNWYDQLQSILSLFRIKQAAMAPNAKRRKLATTQVEEINFDPAARQEFLTGFRKRKQQRAKHAQEVAEKRAREDRIEARKQVSTYLPIYLLPGLQRLYPRFQGELD